MSTTGVEHLHSDYFQRLLRQSSEMRTTLAELKAKASLYRTMVQGLLRWCERNGMKPDDDLGRRAELLLRENPSEQ